MRSKGHDEMVGNVLRDIEPFFYKRSIVYVDVGAYHGNVFSEILRSGLVVHEAHLIEPNPASFGVLKENVEAAASKGRFYCHNLALGASEAPLRIRQAGTMSKVVGASSATFDGGDNVFQAEASSLDNLVKQFTTAHISFLKIDVEGYEEEVLKGAVRLLETQSIDVIYLEAGMNADNPQQCYYRKIEDFLLPYRYRLFRIYEQHNEWLEDSPLLRRANLAFMSEKFARDNPYRLSKELMTVKKKYERAESELAALRDAVPALENERQSLLAKIEDYAQNERIHADARKDIEEQLSQVRHERLQLSEILAVANSDAEAIKSELQRERTKSNNIIKELKSTIAGKERELDRKAAEVKSIETKVKRHLSYRLGREIIVGTRSVKGLLGLPYALWRANRQFKQSSGATSKKNKRPSTKIGKQGGNARSRERSSSSLSSRATNVISEAIAEVQDLEIKLWGGFSRYAKPELERIRENQTSSNDARAAAAHALARWEYMEENFTLASQRIDEALNLSTENLMEKITCQVQCLIRIGNLDRAQKILIEYLNAPKNKVDIKVLYAEVSRRMAEREAVSTDEIEKIYLEKFNDVMADANLARIHKVDLNLPLSITNITSTAEDNPESNLKRVTVIIPAFNASATIRTAIGSLRAQTWRNLEIIVVDDCSTDNTCEIVEAMKADDNRIKLVRRSLNGGAYPARNDGIAAATGEFITVHDSDDWSHPQKIERQMAVLKKNPRCVAVMSHWLRVGQELEVVGSWRPKKSLIDLNFSSLIFRREILDRIGGWDEVRVGGDAELRSRILAIYGEKAICKTRHHEILSLSLAREDSLTRSKATHVRTIDHGLRWQYRDSYRYWHSTLVGNSSASMKAAGQYPVPLGNRRITQQDSNFDLVFVCDFSLKGGAFVSTLNYIIAASRAGYKVGAIHWPKYDLPGSMSLNPNFYKACADHNIDVLTVGDSVKSKFIVIGYPAILQHLPDSFASVEADQVLVLVNQFATRLVDGTDRQYDPQKARSHLGELFGKEGIWIPISNWVGRLMAEDTEYRHIYSQPWCPLIDTQRWCSSPIEWRGNERERPIIGRHGRDAYTKWPANLDSLKDAYCADKDVEVRFLGGAKQAIGRLGYTPSNWKIQKFNLGPVMEFIDGLDFFVHFPHENYIEEFGRAPMEAMARGKLVVLPPQFAETFGDAAVYCTPDKVASTIEKFWRDEDGYRTQAERGRSFVLRECTYESLPDRLRAIDGFGLRGVAKPEHIRLLPSPANDLPKSVAGAIDGI